MFEYLRKTVFEEEEEPLVSLQELIAPDPSLGPYYPHNKEIKY